jgi:hypothetical protein
MSEFKHTTYGLSVAGKWSPRALYSKKPWVPDWLWNLVAHPDLLSHLAARTATVNEEMRLALIETLQECGNART